MAAQKVQATYPGDRGLNGLEVLDIQGDVGVGDNQVIVTHHLN